MLEWKYQLPSLHQVKKFKLPDSFLQCEFCLLQIHHSICCQFHQSFLTALEAAILFRYPVQTDRYIEIFHGRKWNTDSRRASQLLNHLGGSAKKFCRFCMADRDATPQLISEERTEKSLEKIRDIQSQLTAKSKSEKSTEVGLRDVPNSLLYIPADLFKSLPMEVLHTKLLG
eukprot:Em0017g675a